MPRAEWPSRPRVRSGCCRSFREWWVKRNPDRVRCSSRDKLASWWRKFFFEFPEITKKEENINDGRILVESRRGRILTATRDLKVTEIYRSQTEYPVSPTAWLPIPNKFQSNSAMSNNPRKPAFVDFWQDWVVS
jgi:hypothetical protein